MTDELKYRIRFTRGTLAGQLFPLGGEPVILGRSHTCSIRLMEPDVSARHVMLSVSPKGVGMEVISSRRTVLDGTALKTGDRVPVKAGQGVTMGGTASFEVECYLSDGDATEMPMGGDLPTGFPDATRKPSPGRGAVLPAPVAEPPTGARPDTRLPVKLTGADTKTAFRRQARVAGTAYPGTTATQAAPPPIAGGEETEGTEAFAAAGDATQVLRTRAATPQELAYMRELHNKKRRRRLWARLALGLCLTGMAAGVYVWLALHAQEETLSVPPAADEKARKTWNLMDSDLRDLKPEETASGDTIYFNYPFVEDKTTVTVVSPKNGKTVWKVRTWVGRDRDVPLNLELAAERRMDSLDQDLPQAFDAWAGQLQGMGIEKQRQLETDFFGDDPGIPCLRWTYRRTATADEKDDWTGVLSFFRLQDICFAYFREVPRTEELRAESLLLPTQTFFNADPGIVTNRWMGMAGDRQYRDSLEVLKKSVKELLTRNMATEWEEIEDKLTVILIRTFRKREECKKDYQDALKSGKDGQVLKKEEKAVDDNEEEYKAALNSMACLRDMQTTVWKNARIARYRVPENDRGGAGKRIDERIRSLFRSPDDRRTELAKREKWWEQ